MKKRKVKLLHDVYCQLSRDGGKWSLSISIHKDGKGYGTGFILDKKPTEKQIDEIIDREFTSMVVAKQEAESDLLNL